MKGDDLISAVEYLRVLRKNFVVILILATIGNVIGYFVANSLPKKYNSEVLLAVQVASVPDIAAMSNSVSLTVAEAISLAAVSELDATRRDAVARAGYGEAALGRFAVKAEVITGTSVLHLTVTGASPEEAARYGDALALTLAAYGSRISPKTATGLEAVKVAPVAPASVPEKSVSMAPVTLALVSAGIAGLIAYVLLLLRAVSRRRIRGAEDLRELVGEAYAGEVSPPNADTPTDATQSTSARLGWVVKGDEGHAAVVGQIGRQVGDRSAAHVLAEAVTGLGRSVLVVEVPPLGASRSSYGAGFVQGALDPVNAPLPAALESKGVHVLAAGGTSEDFLGAARADGAPAYLARLRRDYDLVLFDAGDRAPMSTLLALADLTHQAVITVTRDEVDAADVERVLEALQPGRRADFVSWRAGGRHTTTIAAS